MSRPKLTLERELLGLLGAERNACIAARYYGFDGRGGQTLQSVGNTFGVTRERVRQIVTAASAPLRDGRPPSPVLDRTIGYVADHMPATAGAIESGIRSEGLTTRLFRLEGVAKAAELLGRRLPFAITAVDGERLVHAPDIPPLDSILQIARRVVARYGMATASEVAANVRNCASGVGDTNLVASVLGCERGFRWLDRSTGWFWSDSGKNPVLHRIRKILSVANPICVSQLKVGISRDHRMKGFSPPRQVFLEFCRQAPGLHVCNDTIEANPRVSPDAVLSAIEKQMVRMLSEQGGTISASDLISLCRHIGLNRRTCYLYLVHSPIISKDSHGRYGLVGSGGVENRATHRSPGEAAGNSPRVTRRMRSACRRDPKGRQTSSLPQGGQTA